MNVAEDYAALRTGCGASRPGRDLLRVHGADAASYLQGQCSQDLDPLVPGAHADSLVLAPDGKVTALVRVLRLAEDDFVLETEGGFGEVLAARLARFRLRAKVGIDPLDWSVVALRGARAEAVAREAREASGPPEGGPLGLGVAWPGWSGVDLVHRGPAPEDPPPGARWCGDEAWEACRVEAGVPRMGRELDDRTIPAEVPGLVERTVSFTKGCYTGQELVARLDARGNRVARRLVGVVATGTGDGAAAAALRGAELRRPAEERVVGRITSAVWSPGLQAGVALAYLHRSVELPAAVAITVAAGPPVDGEARPLPLA